MVRVLSLIWTLALSVAVSGLSFFYIHDEVKHGFPLYFVKDQLGVDGVTSYNFNYWLLGIDILIWWLLFSLLWIIIKNYVLELD